MRLRLREASRDDVEAIIAIEEAGFISDKFSRQQLRYLLTRAKARTWVLMASGEAVAYCTLLLPAHPRPARLYSIAVLPAWQGQGLGSRLIRKALQYSRESGYKRCVLEVRAKASSTVRLYREHGFELVGTLPGYYENNDDALRMSKQLGKVVRK